MAVDMFLKLGSVTGASKDKIHANEINVLAWSGGLTNSGSTQGGSDAGIGRVSLQGLKVTKFADRSTPNVMPACCDGSHFDGAQLAVRKAGGFPVEYLKVQMSKMFVTRVSTEDSYSDSRLTENVMLNFERVTVDYTPPDEKGAACKPIPFALDFAGNSGE